MRLKLLTAAFMIAVVGLLIASPVLLGPPPNKSAPREVKRRYGVRTLHFLEALVVAFAGSGVGSYFVMKKARYEYREQSLNNLRDLLEGATKRVKNPDQNVE